MTDKASALRQFETEKRLAATIMRATAKDRPDAYAHAYGELYRLFPDLQTEQDYEAGRIETSMAFIAPFVDRTSAVAEIGAGRGHLARALARVCRLVIAFDVAPLAEADALPDTMQYRMFDGLSLPLADGSVDAVISDNVLEHLHPDDAGRQVAEAFRVLKGSGHVLIFTPNRTNGPHDISRGFSARPEGLHLKEYSTAEVCALLAATGFESVRAYMGFKGRYVAVSPGLGTFVESIVALMPRKLSQSRAARWLLPNRFSARKPGSVAAASATNV